MRIEIVGRHLPGREWCRQDGSTLDNVHVGVQVRRDPTELIPGDVGEARWEVEVDVAERDGTMEFRGPAVQGRRGDRFLYLTWGTVDAGGGFEMFRRAKLMLSRIPTDLVRSAIDQGTGLVAEVDLTAEDGGPRCARVDPPHLGWSLPTD